MDADLGRGLALRGNATISKRALILGTALPAWSCLLRPSPRPPHGLTIHPGQETVGLFQGLPPVSIPLGDGAGEASLEVWVGVWVGVRIGISNIKKVLWNQGLFLQLAERQGFEPWVSFPTLDFESSAIDHSATSPGLQS
jgi:hypothetical protein